MLRNEAFEVIFSVMNASTSNLLVCKQLKCSTYVFLQLSLSTQSSQVIHGT